LAAFTTSTDPALAFDPISQTVVLFGGAPYPGFYGTATNTTWSWNGSSWTQLSPARSPSARVQAVMVTDDAAGAVELLGGTDVSGNLPSDTWTANTADPTFGHTVQSPAPNPITTVAPSPNSCDYYTYWFNPTASTTTLTYAGGSACDKGLGFKPSMEIVKLQLQSFTGSTVVDPTPVSQYPNGHTAGPTTTWELLPEYSFRHAQSTGYQVYLDVKVTLTYGNWATSGFANCTGQGTATIECIDRLQFTFSVGGSDGRKPY
jgi:hypothetical protein